jgi:GR25 family glycosyltransferase involved in LPS biosynthesis
MKTLDYVVYFLRSLVLVFLAYRCLAKAQRLQPPLTEEDLIEGREEDREEYTALSMLRRKISAACIITPLNDTHPEIPSSESVNAVLARVRHVIPDSRLFPAVMNASMDRVGLYHQVLNSMELVYSGYQVQNAGVVGCFTAHLNLWRTIPAGETWLVFEDDASMSHDDLVRLGILLMSLRGQYFDVINLAQVFPTPEAEPSPLSQWLHHCPSLKRGCEIMGTRAYFITSTGAEKLIRQFHAQGSRFELPVDIFIAAMQTHMDPSFVMAATKEMFIGTSHRPSMISHASAICLGHPRERKLFKEVMLSFVAWTVMTIIILTLAQINLHKKLAVVLPSLFTKRDLED